MEAGLRQHAHLFAEGRHGQDVGPVLVGDTIAAVRQVVVHQNREREQSAHGDPGADGPFVRIIVPLPRSQPSARAGPAEPSGPGPGPPSRFHAGPAGRGQGTRRTRPEVA